MNKSSWPYFLGCPQWTHPDWPGSLFPAAVNTSEYLRYYATLFNAVEGNTTFYSVPSAETVKRWDDATGDHFHFCFKLPQAITHHAQLTAVQRETTAFLNRLVPLQAKLGPIMIQLPASFSPKDFGRLSTFVSALTREFTYVVELRHAGFFDKGESEKRLNQFLQEQGIDRVMFDSRALFSINADDRDAMTGLSRKDRQAVVEAQGKKPRLPVHAVALAQRPVVRFVGRPGITTNETFLMPWRNKIAEWVEAGKTPYFFTHMPSNGNAPALAHCWHQLLAQRLLAMPELDAVTRETAVERQQQALF